MLYDINYKLSFKVDQHSIVPYASWRMLQFRKKLMPSLNLIAGFNNLTVAQLVNKFLAFRGIRKFISMHTRADAVPCPCQINPLHIMTPYLISTHFNISHRYKPKIYLPFVFSR
jgi:hypothetical protein